MDSIPVGTSVMYGQYVLYVALDGARVGSSLAVTISAGLTALRMVSVGLGAMEGAGLVAYS
jgi:hypothetical protein